MFLIVSSARRHGIADEDMVHAVIHPIRIHDLGDGFLMHVGPAEDGSLLEVGTVDRRPHLLLVHAMHARRSFLPHEK